MDDVSQATWVYLMVDKGETSHFLREFIIMVKNQFDTSVKVLRSDNGLENQCNNFTMTMAFYAKVVVLKPPNKMVELNENIDMA